MFGREFLVPLLGLRLVRDLLHQQGKFVLLAKMFVCMDPRLEREGQKGA